VDVAIVEVGLGGRLDSTNIITPLVSLITNISWDHKDLLGNTLPKIAFEKAGIIKPGVPVIISERQAEVSEVFNSRANNMNSAIRFANDQWKISSQSEGQFLVSHGTEQWNYELDLKGSYQINNIAGVLAVVEELKEQGFSISQEHVKLGLRSTAAITGLKGRWQRLHVNPLVVCDTGHNESGIREVLKQVRNQKYEKLYIIIGMVNDKDSSGVLCQLPMDASYLFCQAKIPRALPAKELEERASAFGLKGIVIEDVNQAIRQAREMSGPNDFIFIGGSTFVVAEIDGL
jgi:dihydrofolate synthase/folylpolyglutamate synthase